MLTNDCHDAHSRSFFRRQINKDSPGYILVAPQNVTYLSLAYFSQQYKTWLVFLTIA